MQYTVAKTHTLCYLKHSFSIKTHFLLFYKTKLSDNQGFDLLIQEPKKATLCMYLLMMLACLSICHFDYCRSILDLADFIILTSF